MIVYKLTSPSGKSYIGLTVATVKRRFSQHKTLWRKLKKRGVTDYRGHQCTSLLFFAFDKYPPEEWWYDVLFESDDSDAVRTMEIAMIQEHGTLAPGGYNVLLGGQLGNAGRKLNLITRNKMSIARSAYYKTDEGHLYLVDHSAKMRVNNPSKGCPGPMSEEHKRKIGMANSRKKRTDEQKAVHSDEMKRRWQDGSYDNRDLWTDERKAHQAAVMSGRTRTDEQKHKIADGNSQEWTVTLPSGEEQEIKNLRQFCKDHGLSQGNLVTYGKTKGYKAKKKAP